MSHYQGVTHCQWILTKIDCVHLVLLALIAMSTGEHRLTGLCVFQAFLATPGFAPQP